MNIVKRTGRFLRDCVEVYLPSISFILLFGIFLAGIFARYILKNPIIWSNEVVSICFLWMVLSAACYCQRRRSHVIFTLVYDLLPRRAAEFTAFLGNGIILAALVLSFVPTVKYIRFMAVQKSSMLRIPISILYSPYLIFMVFIAAYLVIEMVEEFFVFTGIGAKTTDTNPGEERKK